jgi:hypothetical protein
VERPCPPPTRQDADLCDSCQRYIQTMSTIGAISGGLAVHTPAPVKPPPSGRVDDDGDHDNNRPDPAGTSGSANTAGSKHAVNVLA